MLRQSLEAHLGMSWNSSLLRMHHSSFASYTITNLQQWDHVHLLNSFWKEHESTFSTYLTFCYDHPTPISLVSIYLCGLDLQTLHAAHTTYQAIVPNHSFVHAWIRQIVSFGHLAQCHITQEHQTISVRHRKLYITSLLYPITYYYPLHDQLHKIPFTIDIDKLQKAWSIHHLLSPTLRKISPKKQIHTSSRSIDSFTSPILLLPTSTLFASIWPLPLRQSFPKEFDDSLCWCIDTGHVVVRLQSLTWPTLHHISQVDSSTLFDAITIHQSLTSLWHQYEYLLQQELNSPKQRYISANYLANWCKTIFGVPLMATLECVDTLRSHIQERYQSLFNTCLGALQHIPQNNVKWCKKTLTMTIYNWSICIHPMPSFTDWQQLPCLLYLTAEERYHLYQALHLFSIQE